MNDTTKTSNFLGHLHLTFADDSSDTPLKVKLGLVNELTLLPADQTKIQLDAVFSRRAELVLLNMLEFNKTLIKLEISTHTAVMGTTATIEYVQTHMDFRHLTITFVPQSPIVTSPYEIH